MKNQKAIATIAIGEKYYSNWKKFCEPNWKQYADRYGFDLVCLQQPLDTSERARRRPTGWQKCLILSQDFAGSYDQIVFIDSDIVINACAPDITAGVPLDKVGVTENRVLSDVAFLERLYRLVPNCTKNYTPQEYYRNWGLSVDCDKWIECGVFVLSSRFHRTIFEHVYYSYEDGKYHAEGAPLSYELLKAGLVHLLDPRFNVIWPDEVLVHYPFLISPAAAPKGLRARIERKIQALVNPSSSLRTLRAAALNTAFQSSFFLHFTGTHMEMHMLKQHATSWWDVLT
jgi:hypothetical protein